MIPIKTLKSILVWLCKLVLTILDPNSRFDEIDDGVGELNKKAKDLRNADDISKDAEIEYLRKKADVLEEMLRDEIRRNTEQQRSLKAPPPNVTEK